MQTSPRPFRSPLSQNDPTGCGVGRTRGRKHHPTSQPAARPGPPRTKASDGYEDAGAARALRFLFPQYESYTAHRVQQLVLGVPIELTAEAHHLGIDHIIDWRLASRFLPDIAGQHLARYD